jgi:hypothetical protein
MRTHGFAVRWQERQARAVLGENIACATVEHRLCRVNSRLGHASHTVTGCARAAQVHKPSNSVRAVNAQVSCATHLPWRAVPGESTEKKEV